MSSIAQMLNRIHGLCGTNDISPWEDEFIESCMAKYKIQKTTSTLSDKQVEIIERIFKQHYGD